MRKLLVFGLFFAFQFTVVNAQYTGSFSVQGSVNKFYPVIFTDGNWGNNRATELEIGRSDINLNEGWRGSLISKFRFHDLVWGNGSGFADVEMQANNGYGGNLVPFIAGWKDASLSNSTQDFIIWLKGQTYYSYTSNVPQKPVVYDDVQKALPYQEVNGPAHIYKESIDNYVNSRGKSTTGSLFTLDGGLNYMGGDLGLGTFDTKGYKLAVNGKVRAQEILVETNNWPDYVFHNDYRMMNLPELESYIKENKHLPDMPSAKKAEKEGIGLGEMNRLLLKKVEELTLHVIELSKRLDQQNKNK
ncbi:hypothetical protein [Pedobacter cryoconitis]|uniref:hypothetical protein n=1 Tax=Pedobacter cryoconitis TaxID=188932 RepID=UPI00161FFCD9|nr:hypothetical protein [Pedobacter cryoconitis]MBB5649147.1 hypothetical protein [Pedobacter cryoconitis]